MPNSAQNLQPKLTDQFGRAIDYIRLSITDRCDFRCVYCMAEEMTFLPRDEVLSLEECARLVKIFVGLGVNKVRITGGEPLVRKNALWLFEEIGKLKNLNELVLTTNGSQLEKQAQDLKNAGVKRINISVDSLDAARFKKITRTGELDKVLRGIQAAKLVGFENIKLNTVLMRGMNDDEALSLVNFAIAQSIDISFIEEMPLGDVNHIRESTFCSNEDTLKILKSEYPLIASTETTGGPARYWRVANTDTKIGFISPHSHNFCESCNRVRITCKGELYLCLGQEDKIDLMPLLRRYPEDDQPIIDAVLASMAIKPKGHDFDLRRAAPAVIRFMSHTGG
ncbi:MAG: GTP 3',8-cyclase MoaA [Methylotenera sp.]|nr:GTP 3',8-cyclase MoaA [Methylotenera sp.]MDO9394704.1 GTP 3',8-cyclase MoaA [Methylotenera sp.]MDP1521836.1 GTP 3',8-cyclase MoaA [Methylotenera sp.]MDP2070704.1 GTP 3',8-cyclase MoaA [Methylotenera sp.]MDP2231434.1 GTP 3',8-cyclase MoaA [Methylotenera sp.]MDP3004815.1 GTP 3',8-cyclase MoaA [Methylotenera sp.]